MRERPFVADLVSDQTIPKMFKVKQEFPRPKIEPEDKGCNAGGNTRNH